MKKKAPAPVVEQQQDDNNEQAEDKPATQASSANESRDFLRDIQGKNLLAGLRKTKDTPPPVPQIDKYTDKEKQSLAAFIRAAMDERNEKMGGNDDDSEDEGWNDD